MKTRRRKMRKTERAKLVKRFPALMTELGFSINQSSSPSTYEYRRETTARNAGLRVTLITDWMDPWLAVRFLRDYPRGHLFNGGNDRTAIFGDVASALSSYPHSAVNPCSGKFNLHCVGVLTADEVINDARRHLVAAIGE